MSPIGRDEEMNRQPFWPAREPGQGNLERESTEELPPPTPRHAVDTSAFEADALPRRARSPLWRRSSGQKNTSFVVDSAPLHQRCKCVRGNSTVQLWTVLAALKRSRGKRPNDLHGAASLSNEFGS
jgi:hypothetical protein